MVLVWVLRPVLGASILAGGMAAVLAVLDTPITLGVAVAIFSVSVVSLLFLRYVDPLALAQTAVLWGKRESVVQQSESSSEVVRGSPSIRASVVVDTPSQIELELNKTLQSRTSERDAIFGRLKSCQVELARAKLNWFAERRLLNGKTTDHAVVRFATYSDYKLAKQIRAIIQETMLWRVELDNNNKPIIEPSSDTKVLFESDLSGTFLEVVEVFKSDALLNVPVDVYFASKSENNCLLVTVMPTVRQ